MAGGTQTEFTEYGQEEFNPDDHEDTISALLTLDRRAIPEVRQTRDVFQVQPEMEPPRFFTRRPSRQVVRPSAQSFPEQRRFYLEDEPERVTGVTRFPSPPTPTVYYNARGQREHHWPGLPETFVVYQDPDSPPPLEPEYLEMPEETDSNNELLQAMAELAIERASLPVTPVNRRTLLPPATSTLSGTLGDFMTEEEMEEEEMRNRLLLLELGLTEEELEEYDPDDELSPQERGDMILISRSPGLPPRFSMETPPATTTHVRVSPTDLERFERRLEEVNRRAAMEAEEAVRDAQSRPVETAPTTTRVLLAQRTAKPPTPNYKKLYQKMKDFR